MNPERRVFVALILATVMMLPTHSAVADNPELKPCISSNLYQVTTQCERSADEVSGLIATSGSAGYDYRLQMQCKDNVQASVCDNPRTCVTDSGEQGLWFALQRLDIEDAPPDAAWEYYGHVCLRPPDIDRFKIITPDKVWERMKLIDWPTAELITQPPDGRTLVNFQTNFYSTLTLDPQSETVQLFSIPVQIEATPIEYTWHWGDETDSEVTDWPGAPVPEGVTEDDLEDLITHEYLDADVTVAASVDVTYRGRFRIDGGEWTAIEQTLTLAGEPIDLEVIEARVHLVG